MKKIGLLLFVIGILNSVALAESVSLTANVSCRTEGGTYVNTNRSDPGKLTVRASSTGSKSWIKFTGLALDLARLKSATLTVSLNEAKAGAQHFDVSYVNDNCLDNIDWTETGITWNNAPGNLTTDLGLLDSTKTTLVQTVNFTDGVAGQSFTVNVLAALQADTDGIVQFVLHNSPNLLNLSTHDNATVARRPVLNIAHRPLGADNPTPSVGAVVETSLPSLSWTLPEPNVPGTPIYCDVYLGYLLAGQTDPNRPQMDKITLGNGVTSVAINTDNFHTFGALVDKTTYYWFVDCHDSSRIPNPVPAEKWSFSTYNNIPPDVNAGADQFTWGLPKTINLLGMATDDGLPNPPAAMTYQWTQIANAAPTITFSPNNALPTSVNITTRGDYLFQLTASDGDKSTSDQVRVVVGINACDASHLKTSQAYDTADKNQDCIVDLNDFAIMAIDWMDCTDVLTNCGR